MTMTDSTIRVKRMLPHERREFLIEEGLKFSRERGFRNLNAKRIAGYSCIAKSLIVYYFRTSREYAEQVLQEAMRREMLDILLDAPEFYRAKYSATLKTKLSQYLLN
jgi:AcrR family transcriptional regulator